MTPRRHAITAGRRGTPAGMRALAIALLPLLASCQREAIPTAPSPPPSPPPVVTPDPAATPLRWSDERYYLEIIGGDISDIPSLPPCSPHSTPAGGKSVNTFVWFAWEGEELVGRSRPPYAATIELRIRRVSSSILGVAVTGTVTGGVPDEYDLFLGRRDSVFNAAEPLTIEGVIPPQSALDPRGPVLGGVLRGHSVFNDRQGASSFCTNVRYYLQPSPPGGVHDDPTVPPFVPGLRGSARAR